MKVLKMRLLVVFILLVLFWLMSVWSLKAQGPFSSTATKETSTKIIELVNHLELFTEDIFIQGSYAYIGEDTKLTILDISNPVSPTVVGQTAPLPNAVRDIYVLNNYAYVATGYSGLRIIDVSAPTNPIEVGSYEDEWDGVYGVVATDSYAYILLKESDNLFQTINISSPITPTHVSSFITSTSPYLTGQDMAIADDYLYISRQGVKLEGSLVVVNVVDSANPLAVSVSAPPGSPQGVAVIGDYAYVAFGRSYFTEQGGLQILDISDPTTPVEVGLYERDWSAFEMVVASDYAYIIGRYGLRLVDISDPTNPIEASFYNKEWGWKVKDYNLAVIGDYVYIAAGDEGLLILRYSEAGSPISVTISGPSTSVVQTSYRYSATVSPATASLPVSYTWAPTPNTGQGTAVVTYTWPTWWGPGPENIEKIISVMATNVDGTAIDTHTVTICIRNCYQAYLPLILK